MMFEEFSEELIIMNRRKTPDGMGGTITVYEEGAHVQGAVITRSSTAQREAEKTIGAVVYELTLPREVNLDFHDVLKRVKTGGYLRLTSETKDVQTPQRATFGFSQATAEEYTLP